MHLHPSFRSRLSLTSADEVFAYLHSTLKSRRPTSPTYYVNWQKALNNVEKVEMALHQLDFILGKPDLGRALFQVIKSNPNVVDALPILFASRESRHLLVSKATGPTEFKFLTKAITSDLDIHNIVAFCDEIGLLDFIEEASIASFTDFVHGVEVGIDTNGRKNRGGKQMEDSVEEYVNDICKRHGFRYLKEATADHIRVEFGKPFSVEMTNRRIDFAINTPHNLYLVETNYYDGGGSKLKSTAGEYRALFDLVKSCGHQFIWITDGRGWHSTLNALRETFDYTDYILNLEMVACGVLEDIVTT